MDNLKPTGTCWCGCGAATAKNSFFIPGHDSKSESAILKLHYGGSRAALLRAHGYGPGGKNLQEELANADAGRPPH